MLRSGPPGMCRKSAASSGMMSNRAITTEARLEPADVKLLDCRIIQDMTKMKHCQTSQVHTSKQLTNYQSRSSHKLGSRKFGTLICDGSERFLREPCV